ncbi:MAG: hypothetical protein P8183_09875, partial [Anaerolineae bacterium]
PLPHNNPLSQSKPEKEVFDKKSFFNKKEEKRQNNKSIPTFSRRRKNEIQIKTDSKFDIGN